MIYLVIIAGILNGLMDLISFRWNKSYFSKIKNKRLIQFMNPKLSWRNKWKNGDINNGPKFFGSSTFLVWTTDLWHLLKVLMITCLLFGIIFYNGNVIDVLFYLFIFTTSFSITYNGLQIKFSN